VTRSATFLVALLMAWPRPAAAQCSLFGQTTCPLDAPRWVGEFATLSANAFLAGMTAGITQRLGGRSFGDGFVRGALGGAVVYGGKRLVVERFDGAGLLGREVAAVGSSMVRNASDGVALFDELILPFGPIRLYVRPADRTVQPKLDALAFGWTIYGIAESELSFDAGESLSAGAPVFVTDGKVIQSSNTDSTHAAGLTESGVIVLAAVPAAGAEFRARAFAHERVHILQGDHIFTTWTDPLESRLLRSVPAAARIGRWADVGLSTDVLRVFGIFFDDYDERPWELEAAFLAR
jgi:hypothetical protein